MLETKGVTQVDEVVTLRSYDRVAQGRLKKHCKHQAFLDCALAILHSENTSQAVDIFCKLSDVEFEPKRKVAWRVMLWRFRNEGYLKPSSQQKPVYFAELKCEFEAIAHPPEGDAQ